MKVKKWKYTAIVSLVLSIFSYLVYASSTEPIIYSDEIVVSEINITALYFGIILGFCAIMFSILHYLSNIAYCLYQENNKEIKEN